MRGRKPVRFAGGTGEERGFLADGDAVVFARLVREARLRAHRLRRSAAARCCRRSSCRSELTRCGPISLKYWAAKPFSDAALIEMLINLGVLLQSDEPIGHFFGTPFEDQEQFAR